MLIDLPEHDVPKKQVIAGWMLFPKPEDEGLRRLYCSAVHHLHVMRDLKIAGQPIDPASQKYKWEASGDGMVAVEQRISAMDENEKGMALVGSPEKIVKFFHDYEDFLRRANFNRRVKEGIASGLVLLAACVFQGASARPHRDGKGAAGKAVANMFGLEPSAIRGYFKGFGCVAHLWAAWLLLVFYENDLPANDKIFNGIEHRVPIDFMSDANVDAMLSGAKCAFDFGGKIISTRTVLFDGIDTVEFGWPENAVELIERVPTALVEMLERCREVGVQRKAR